MRGCWFCGGMGYRDYPSNRVPCPVPGHRGRYEDTVRVVAAYMAANPKPYPVGTACPYCRSDVQCKHWTGHGWTRDVPLSEEAL